MSEAVHIEFAAKTEQIAAEHKRMTKSREGEKEVEVGRSWRKY